MLVGERIIVKDLAEDLYDGQVLQKLFGKKKYMCMLLRHFVSKWIACSYLGALVSSYIYATKWYKNSIVLWDPWAIGCMHNPYSYSAMCGAL